MREKRRKKLLLPALIAIALATTTPMAQAAYYSATGYTRWIWPGGKVYILIDTTNKKITFKWDFPFLIWAPMPSGWWFGKVNIWDEKGWTYSLLTGKNNGEITISYTNSYTWVHGEFKGAWVGAFWFVQDSAVADVYVGG